MTALITCADCGHNVTVEDDEANAVTTLAPADDCECACHDETSDAATLSVQYQ